MAALAPTDGARLGYRDLWEAGFIGQPQEETFDPEIAQAYTGRLDDLVVVPDVPGILDPDEIPPISLLRHENATEAYAIQTTKQPFRLDHHGKGWGKVVFATVYQRIGPGRFCCPTRPADRRQVAIKVLNKEVVHGELRKGAVGVDNPYKEVARMRELHNEDYVLSCTDFLEDKESLYIITPKGLRTLKDVITWGRPERTVPVEEAIAIFQQVLKIVDYLQSRGINHHDISPDNLLVMPNRRLVVFDLAKSLRMPVNNATGHRGLMHHPSAFGTRAWMCPEAFRSFPYDGCSMDLWAAHVIFYNLLTNQFLYLEPHQQDHRFKLFVLAQGLQDIDTNELAREVIQEFVAELQGNHRGQKLLRTLGQMADAHLRLAPEPRALLAASLNVNPAERPTLAQTLGSALFHQGQG